MLCSNWYVYSETMFIQYWRVLTWLTSHQRQNLLNECPDTIQKHPCSLSPFFFLFHLPFLHAHCSLLVGKCNKWFFSVSSPVCHIWTGPYNLASALCACLCGMAEPVDISNFGNIILGHHKGKSQK